MTYDWRTSISSHRSKILRFYWLPLKGIVLNAVDTTGFLIFVVLMYLFIFVDFVKIIDKKEESYGC